MRSLVVKLTAGADAPERCLQALTVASVAVASGAEVSVWLTGESVWLATPDGELEIPESPPASTLMDALLTTARVQVCTQCAARRGLTAQDLKPGAVIAGAGSFVEQALAADVQALVY
jgi:predicted peroxiredoxin